MFWNAYRPGPATMEFDMRIAAEARAREDRDEMVRLVLEKLLFARVDAMELVMVEGPEKLAELAYRLADALIAARDAPRKEKAPDE